MVDSDCVYFAFPDGSLRYDCVSCGAICCRGHGYILQKSDQLIQLERRPSLRFFLSQSTSTLVKNIPPACFFLTDSGQCQIQVEGAYENKPETCRLFPFNNIRSVGSHLIVGPHESLCPLQVNLNGERSIESAHAFLYDTMAAQGLNNSIPAVIPIVQDLRGLMALEKHILTDVGHFQHKRYYEFVDHQLRLTIQARLEKSEGIIVSTDDSFNKRRRLLEILGVEDGELPTIDAIDQLLTQMTPHLRSLLAFRSPRLVHGNCQKHLTLSLIPEHLLALNVIAHLAIQAGMPQLTFQSVSRLSSNFHHLLALLSFSNVVVTWRRDALIDLGVPNAPLFQKAIIGLSQSLIRRRQQQRPVILADALAQHNMWEGVDRIRFLNLAADKLHGKIEPMGVSESSRGLTASRMKSSLQQWVVGAFDGDRLNDYVERRSRAVVK